MLLNDVLTVFNGKTVGKSFAKINLTLDVISKREDGYHEISSIMQTVGLFDLVLVDKNSDKISVKTNIAQLPTNEKNIAYKAAKLFYDNLGKNGGAKILIHKNIPIGAGLAGGSGNGAAVLVALNRLYDSPFSEKELCEIGAKIGADVPFCMIGGTSLLSGIGEKITKIPQLKSTTILIVKPSVSISTQSIYTAIDNIEISIRPDNNKMIDSIINFDLTSIGNNLVNVMEEVTCVQNPIIADIKQKMINGGAIGSLMSGSGSSVFGIFSDDRTADRCAKTFFAEYNNVVVCRTI